MPLAVVSWFLMPASVSVYMMSRSTRLVCVPVDVSLSAGGEPKRVENPCARFCLPAAAAAIWAVIGSDLPLSAHGLPRRGFV